MLAGYTPCPTRPQWGWRRCSSSSICPQLLLSLLFVPTSLLPLLTAVPCLPTVPLSSGRSPSPCSGLPVFVPNLPLALSLPFCPLLLLSVYFSCPFGTLEPFCFFCCLLRPVYLPPSPRPLSQRLYLSYHASDCPGPVSMSLCPQEPVRGWRWWCLWRRVYWLLLSSCRPVAMATRSEGPHCYS